LTDDPAHQGFFRRRKAVEIILSSEEAECGLACLAMVAGYHSYHTDLNRLRQRFPVSISGTTLRQLIDFADQLGLSSRPLRVDMPALTKVHLPAIIHWDFAHFVVLEKVTASTITVVDPAHGRRIMTCAEFSHHFTGVTLEMRPSASFTAAEDRQKIRIRDLWTKLQGLGPVAAQLIIVSTVLQLGVLLGAMQIQLVIDEGLGRADADLLVLIAVGFGLVLLFTASLEAIRSWTIAVVVNSLTYQVLGNVVRHLLRLPVAYFERRHVGDIISRVDSASRIQDILGRGLLAALIDGVMSALALVVMFFYSPMLAGVVFAISMVGLGGTLLINRPLRRVSEEQLVEGAREQSYLIETIRAAPTIRLMGREAEREGHWHNLFARFTNASVTVGKHMVVLQFMHSTLTGLQTILVLFLGGRIVLQNDGFSIGMLVAFIGFQQIFSGRMTELLNNLVSLRLVRLHLQRLNDIVGSDREVEDSRDAPPITTPTISLRNVSFKYDLLGREILSDVNLEIGPGDFLVLTGPSGGGKTTLLKLMLGLLKPTGGTIEIAGQPASPAMWRRWRERAGVVAQDDRLLSGTIADNIAFFDSHLDLDRVRSAAASAEIHDDIMRMPMNYLTLVGDMGSSLSGGQKQRVLLARAMYRNPLVMYLDEGTANLDDENERRVVELLAKLPMVRIAVAHRPALIDRAQRILVVSDGKVRGIPEAAAAAA